MNDVPRERRLEFAYWMVDTLREAKARMGDSKQVEVVTNDLVIPYSPSQLERELAWWVSQVERHLAAMA